MPIYTRGSNGELLDRLIEQKRAMREDLLAGQTIPLLLSPQYPAQSIKEVDLLFSEARSSADEGLVLKRWSGLYGPGRHSGTWYKVNRPYARLDVVITAAEQGLGCRATLYLADPTHKVYTRYTSPELPAGARTKSRTNPTTWIVGNHCTKASLETGHIERCET